MHNFSLMNLLLYFFRGRFAVFCLCVVFTNCSGKIDSTTTSAIIPIPIDLEQYTTIEAADFWAAAEAIALELGPESAMEQIRKITKTNHFLVIHHVLDRTNEQSIMIFDHVGKFYKKIIANQEGPGNFSYMKDFFMRNDTLMEIVDNIQQKTFLYNTEGTFLEDVTLGAAAARFVPLDAHFYLLYRGNAVQFDELQITDNLLLIDATSKKMQSFVPIQDALADNLFNVSNHFFPDINENTFLFCDIANDTIYECTKRGVQPRYVLQFSNKQMQQRALTKLADEKAKKSQDYSLALLEWANNQEIIKAPELIVAREDMLFFWFRYKGQHHVFRYNKKSGEGQLFRLNNIRLWPLWYAGEDELLMVVGAPVVQRDALQQQAYPTPTQVRAVFEEVNENSNPIIIRVNTSTLFSK